MGAYRQQGEALIADRLPVRRKLESSDQLRFTPVTAISPLKVDRDSGGRWPLAVGESGHAHGAGDKAEKRTGLLLVLDPMTTLQSILATYNRLSTGTEAPSSIGRASSCATTVTPGSPASRRKT